MSLFFAIPFLPGGNLEWMIVVMAALMIFGSRLPEVALRAVAHVMRIRRAIAKMWRDTGLEDELRRVRRDIELSIPREADFKVQPKAKDTGEINDARAAAERAREASERSARSQAGSQAGAGGSLAGHDDAGEDGEGSLGADPDAHRMGGFRLEAAPGIVAEGDSLAIEERDQTPGFDRQEPSGYAGADAYGVEGSVSPELAEASPADDRPAPGADSGAGDEPDEDLGGSHFGAGVKPGPARPS